MLKDEEIIRCLYQDPDNYLAVIYKGSSNTNTILKADLVVPVTKVLETDFSDVSILIGLEFLLETSRLKLTDGNTLITYKLAKRILAMFATIKKFGVLRLEDNYRKLDFLQLAKTAVLLSHVGNGMVDFKFKGVSYTVRKSTPYSFFESQYNNSKLSN